MASKSKGSDKKKVLFLCFHNSARSQMAEGLLRAKNGDSYEVYSAGVEASRVDPRAVKVMNEIGIDISGQRSKTMNEYKGILFDLAVTVCDKAKVMCPICGVSLKAPATAPAAKEVILKIFKDPAVAEGSEEDQINAFRQARDEIKDWIAQTFE
ncbi:Protein ArsC [uncultured archaeon]|nr:Protein ArsC [uncultured archaeon]